VAQLTLFRHRAMLDRIQISDDPIGDDNTAPLRFRGRPRANISLISSSSAAAAQPPSSSSFLQDLLRLPHDKCRAEQPGTVALGRIATLSPRVISWPPPHDIFY
jgi:hypothetical protein